MPDLLLPRLKREIEARLAELRPVLEEAEQLEAAREALLAEREALQARRRLPPHRRPARYDAGEPELPPRRAAARAPAPEPKPSSPSGGDPLRDTIVGLVEERPGVSLAEIVSVTKLPKGEVAAVVGALKREGVLADEAGGVKLASRKPLTLAEIAAAAAARDDGVSDDEWEAARPKAKRARARS
jgi:hypothetical protein